ncbi:MAG: GatB/YqeY domain-containing protein [Synergistaceae bacterium]|nr:GatB/YqeY domain-containing protein [Synergistaceae bacterium]
MSCALEERIQRDLVSALKNRDDATLSALRMLKTAIQLASTEKGRTGGLTDADVEVLIKRAIKQRNEAAELYNMGNAPERAAEELEEARILTGYLPAQMDDAELERIVSGVIGEVGAAGPKDLGRVMGRAMKLTQGKADGGRVRDIAARLLG